MTRKQAGIELLALARKLKIKPEDIGKMFDVGPSTIMRWSVEGVANGVHVEIISIISERQKYAEQVGRADEFRRHLKACERPSELIRLVLDWTNQ